MEDTQENLAQTLARELKEPVIVTALADAAAIIGTPPGWKAETIDLESYLPQPRRKVAKVTLTEAESFIAYLKRHGSLSNATIWCLANPSGGRLEFKAILNDHGEEEKDRDWRDHRAHFTPEKSEEWTRWVSTNRSPMEQSVFAAFLEDNLKDISSSSDTMPTGAQMLKMAVDFEAKQDMRFKSAVRLQSGGVRMEYVADEDKNTVEAMSIFDRFQIAIPVFRADVARYPITARLRYRTKDGKLVFWYELNRIDLELERAAQAMIETIRSQSGLPFFFGEPGH